MLKATCISLTIVVAFAANFASGLYFHISASKRKCFVQDIPDSTTVVGKWIEAKQTHFVTLFAYTFASILLVYIYIFEMTFRNRKIERKKKMTKCIFFFHVLATYRVEIHNPDIDKFEPLPANLGIYFQIWKCPVAIYTRWTNHKINSIQLSAFSSTILGLGMHTEVRDPDNSLILSRIYTAEGEFYRQNVYRKFTQANYIETFSIHST